MKKSTHITGIDNAVSIIQSELKHLEREVFFALFLNKKGGIIQQERLFYGSIAESSIYISKQDD